MARFTRIEVFQEMHKSKIIPVFYDEDISVCKKVLSACYKGGTRVFEFTNRGDFAHEVFLELNKFAIANFKSMILGVGSVIDIGSTSHYLQLGANFIISPIVDSEMAKTCNRRKVAWLPGCGSVNEVSYAHELGAEVVKIFPGKEVGGPSFVKGIKGPIPWSSVMPTGGVELNKDNLQEWFNAGVHCVGVGSGLFKKNNQGTYDYEEISKKLANARLSIT